MKLGDAAIVAVMNDSKAALTFFAERLERFAGPLSSLQIREVMVDMAFLNFHLKHRPVFATDCDLIKESPRIVADRPEMAELADLDYRVRGSLLHHAWREPLEFDRIRVPGATKEQIEASITAGGFTSLFDKDGQFIHQRGT